MAPNNNSSKKYKLFSSTVGVPGGKPPCAFFFSASGCRNGNSCKFSHEKADERSSNILVPETGSVVSSESSRGEHMSSNKNSYAALADMPFAPPPTRPAATSGGVLPLSPTPGNTPRTINTSAPPVSSVETTAATVDTTSGPPEQKKKARRGKRRKSQEENPFVDPKKPKSSVPPNAEEPVNPFLRSSNGHSNQEQAVKLPPKDVKKAPMTNPPPATVDFRSLNLPIAAFSVPAPPLVSATPVKVAETPAAGGAVASPQEPAENPPLVMKQYPLPQSTEVGRKWLPLVQKTRLHPRFATSYDFDRDQKKDEEIGLGGKSMWIKAKPYGEWCSSFPQAIAIDCEMCETMDPVSGQRDSRALCRISVIDAQTKAVLLDSLVKPAWPVIDYRTWINGIGAMHLDNVQFTLRHAQAFLMALCSEETVILGHSVHHDLIALRMEHYCVVDSALLYTVKDAPGAIISLRDLAKTMLDVTMTEPHDSVKDATVALECLDIYHAKDGKVDPIVSTSVPKTNPAHICQLFIHRIPKVCNESHLKEMFASHTFIIPTQVMEIERTGDLGKTSVVFQTPRHANLAFDSLEGKADPDTSGRLQKKVFMRDKDYIRVRKMVREKEKSTKDSASALEATKASNPGRASL